MRVKEPLQAIKTLKGHFIMHVAMFLVSMQVETKLYTDPDSVSLDLATADQRAQITDNYYEYQIFMIISYGHAATALILLVNFWLKYQDE